MRRRTARPPPVRTTPPRLGTLTFTNSAAGAQTFTVQTTEDNIDEVTDETFTVTMSSPIGRGRAFAEPGQRRRSVTTTISGRRRRAYRHHPQRQAPSTLGEDDSATSITVTATLNGGTTRTEATVVTIGHAGWHGDEGHGLHRHGSLASITIPANTASRDGHADHHADGRHGGRGRRDHHHTWHDHSYRPERERCDRHADGRRQGDYG